MKLLKKLMLEEATSQNGNVLSGGEYSGGLSFDMPDFNFGNEPTKGFDPIQTTTTTPAKSSGGGFFSDFNLNGLLDTLLKGGMTWAQIEAAKNGKDVYVQGDNGGQKENITPILMAKFEQQAQAQNTTIANMMEMMKAQMAQNDPKKNPPKDNTLLYVGVGAGILVLLGGVYMIASKNKK